MAEDSLSNQEQTVQCQNCLEFINASLTNCRYCGAVVSLENPPAEGNAKTKVADASRDGYLLTIMARALAVCFIALTFSILSKLALAVFLILLVAVPLMLVRWWVKYRGLQTEEHNYRMARLNTIKAAVVWGAILLLWLFVSVIQSFLLMQR
ncbi:MAG: hypothetical protein KA368_02070 [Acidobacteria bacterium]|nr:hypothetical protein [Acidobacteriota bacterium]